MDLKDRCSLHTFIRQQSNKKWYLTVRNWVKASNAEESGISFASCLTAVEHSIIHSLLGSSSSTGAAQPNLRAASHNEPHQQRGNRHKRCATPASTGFC